MGSHATCSTRRSACWTDLPHLHLQGTPKHLYVTLQDCDLEPEQLTCPANSISMVLQFCLKSSKGLGSCCGILFVQTAPCL